MCCRAAGTGKGLFGGDERVIYWKCEAGQMLREKLLIPITNMAKERALIVAAQQVRLIVCSFMLSFMLIAAQGSNTLSWVHTARQ